MTDTDEREDATASAPSGPDANDARTEDPRAAHLAGQRAFKELTAPIRGAMMLARVLGSSTARSRLPPTSSSSSWGRCCWLRIDQVPCPTEGGDDPAHVADRCLRPSIRYLLRRADRHSLRGRAFWAHRALAHGGCPLRSALAWFTSTNSGAVRKAIQDDTHDVHTVIAHAPVESAAAVSAPASLLIYAFVVDWRLGLLSIATLPIYGLLNAWMMRDMGEKTAEMDRHLTRVSSTMVEFVSGISVVKAFGTVGRSHQRFTQAAEDFSRFYRDWCGPLLKGSALGQASVSPSLILLISPREAQRSRAAGIVSPVQVITCALIALVIPAAIEVLGTTAWSYQIAGAAALRIVDLLSVDPLPAEGHSVPDGSDVEIDDVSFSYGTTLALDDVSPDDPRGHGDRTCWFLRLG